jgi:hypothetical protein
MIKISELQQGNLVVASFEDVQREGIVKELNHEDKEICVETEVQQFWYQPADLYPVPLNDAQLVKLGFEKQDMGDQVKYLKGAFRVLVPKGGDFSDFEMWYREDRRHMKQPIAVHQFQNHYYQMTKVELNLETA